MRLVSTEANGAPFTPLSLSVLRFTGIQIYGDTDQRKVEADVEVIEDRTGDLLLRKPRNSQLSHDCSYIIVSWIIIYIVNTEII